MKKKTIALVVAVILLLSIGGGVGYAALPVGESKKAEHIAIDTLDGALKVGIMSDNQLGQDERFDGYMEDALNLFKKQGVNMIINVGDYTDTALKKNYEAYPALFDKVYGDDKPVTQSILGNHDYWLPQFFDCWQIPFKGTLQRRFMKATGESSPWTHKVVNGYHFIGASPSNGGMGEEAYTQKIDWIKEQIELAAKEDPGKPIFVLTHNNPQNTVYMSAEDGCKNLDDLFSQYPQVISLSGHSHASLLDERSIYQNNYTALNTQCLSYVCYAGGDADVMQEGGDFIKEVPMAMIMTITAQGVSFDRYSVETGEKVGDQWLVPQPVGKESFSYTDEIRSAAAQSPVWPDPFTYNVTQGTDVQAKQVNVLSFTAATHPQAVLAYEVTFTDADGNLVDFRAEDAKEAKNILQFMSDYARAPQSRAATASFPIPADIAAKLPAGSYTVTVTPTSAFSQPGETKTLQVELK